MLKPEIWEGQLKLGWSDNLCIGCLEKRTRPQNLMARYGLASDLSVDEADVD
jgi:hypothetical protein